MAIEQHANGRRYFFFYGGKRPKTRTSIKKYLGTGPVAAYLERRAAELSAARRRKVANEQTERKKIAEAVQASLEAINAAKQVLAAAMCSLGYHQHARGAWRKQRLLGDRVANSVNAGGEPLSSRAGEPFTSAAPESVALKVCEPGAKFNAAITLWLELLGAANNTALEQLKFKIKSTFDDLLEAGESDLERACVGRILVCTVQIQVLAECAAARGSMSPSYLKFLGKRQNAARRRLATAMRTLSFVRAVLQREREFAVNRAKQN